jgi:hypothetical protein
MARASFSRCTVSSRAFAQGLRRWLPTATRLDLNSPQRRQCALAVVPGLIYWEWLRMRGVKTLRVLASIYKSTAAPPTAGWISSQTADSAAAPDSSNSTSRCASSWGLGYFHSTSWVATRLKSNSGHILQDDPSIREEVLESRLEGSVPRVLRFFLRIFRDILAKTSDGPSARVYNST